MLQSATRSIAELDLLGQRASGERIEDQGRTLRILGVPNAERRRDAGELNAVSSLSLAVGRLPPRRGGERGAVYGAVVHGPHFSLRSRRVSQSKVASLSKAAP